MRSCRTSYSLRWCGPGQISSGRIPLKSSWVTMEGDDVDADVRGDVREDVREDVSEDVREDVSEDVSEDAIEYVNADVSEKKYL